MKRLVTILCIVALLCFLSGCAKKTLYPVSDRDTKDYFGTGRFAISVRIVEDETDMREKEYSLWDQAAEFNNQIIEPDVEAYLEKEPYVYRIGDYYTKLEYNEEVWQQGESLEDFSEADKRFARANYLALYVVTPNKKYGYTKIREEDFKTFWFIPEYQ